MASKIQNVLIFGHSFVRWLAYDLDRGFIERAVKSFDISVVVVLLFQGQFHKENGGV